MQMFSLVRKILTYTHNIYMHGRQRTLDIGGPLLSFSHPNSLSFPFLTPPLSFPSPLIQLEGLGMRSAL